MKKTIICGAILASLTLITACQKSIEEQAVREAKLYTEKNCPAKLEEGLVIDSMTFDVSTHTFAYYYTLSGVLDNDTIVDSHVVSDALLESLRNTTSMRAYKERGYRFRYVYHSATNPDKVLHDLVFTKEDYQPNL